MIYITLSLQQVDHLTYKERGDLCRNIEQHLGGQFPHQAWDGNIQCCWSTTFNYRITSVESHKAINDTVQQQLELTK